MVEMTTESVKTMFRPLLTLLLVITWILFIAKGIPYPPTFGWLAAGCVIEWIGERGLKRFRELTK